MVILWSRKGGRSVRIFCGIEKAADNSYFIIVRVQKVEGFVKLAENAVINLESIRHRLYTAKECLECKITDIAFSVSSETYELTKKTTLQTINAGSW